MATVVLEFGASAALAAPSPSRGRVSDLAPNAASGQGLSAIEVARLSLVSISPRGIALASLGFADWYWRDRRHRDQTPASQPIPEAGSSLLYAVGLAAVAWAVLRARSA